MRGTTFGGALLLGGALLSIAASARAVVITAGSASGAPGEVVTVDITMASEGAAVLATQNRIDFTREAHIAARADRNPDCAVNPAIDKNATAFRFLPLGCDPAVDCASVRAFVLSFDNLMPIADAARLYSCAVQIAANAPLAVQATKRMMRMGQNETFEANVHHVFLQLLPLFRSKDFKEGVTAFLEKRTPEFEGR